MTPTRGPLRCWCGWAPRGARNSAGLAAHASTCAVAQAAHKAYRDAMMRRQPEYAHADATAAAQAALDALQTQETPQP